VKIRAGIFVDIMMQTQNFEIHKIVYLENIALHVI